MKSWELEDVAAASQKSKDFFIPGNMERNNQKIDDEVRLHFILKNPSANEPRAERMWVKVIEKKEGEITGYKGLLTNSPVYIKDLQINDVILFNANNIAQTVVKKDDPGWIDSSEKWALVSKLFLGEDGVIRFLYREQPDRSEDSGWRMFTGFEDDEYANNPENIQLMNVGYLLDKDMTLLEPLKYGYGAVFEREGKDKKWEKIENWPPQELEK